MRSKCLCVLLILFWLSSICGAFEVIQFVNNPASAATHWASSKFPVPYAVHSAGGQGISADTVVGEFKKVIAVINKVSPLKFGFNGKTSNVSAGDLKNGIFFDKNFQGGSATLAFHRLSASSAANFTEFAEGDLIFNDKDYNWTKGPTNRNANLFNLFTVMLHEMGHGTGLNHTAIIEAVMFFSYQKDVTKFHPDDKKGIKFIYKPPVSGSLPKLITPINNSVHSFSTIGQAASTLTFRWKGSTASVAPAAFGETNSTTFVLTFAGDSAITKNVFKLSFVGKEAVNLKGTKLNKLKKIQAASPTSQVFWRVDEKNAQGTLHSKVFHLKIS